MKKSEFLKAKVNHKFIIVSLIIIGFVCLTSSTLILMNVNVSIFTGFGFIKNFGIIHSLQLANYNSDIVWLKTAIILLFFIVPFNFITAFIYFIINKFWHK